MLLIQLFDLGYADYEFILEHYKVVTDEIDFSDLCEFKLEDISCNHLIDRIFSCINNEVFSRIINDIQEDKILLRSKKEKSKLLTLCQNRLDEFSPFYNSVDSWFNNEIDGIDMADQTIAKIANQVIKFLRGE